MFSRTTWRPMVVTGGAPVNGPSSIVGTRAGCGGRAVPRPTLDRARKALLHPELVRLKEGSRYDAAEEDAMRRTSSTI